MVSGRKTGQAEIAPNLIMHATEVTDQIISGTQVISGSSPTLDQEIAPSLVRLEIPHGEGLGVYIAIMWSLAVEAGVAGLGFALWQLWKVM
ncbi:MAG TPA: hypothetical protein VGD64_00940 [Acidisarcina sp.]